jgi:hypothetical protein
MKNVFGIQQTSDKAEMTFWRTCDLRVFITKLLGGKGCSVVSIVWAREHGLLIQKTDRLPFSNVLIICAGTRQQKEKRKVMPRNMGSKHKLTVTKTASFLLI